MNGGNCYSCGTKKNVGQDWRERDGQNSKYSSCRDCLYLNDYDYFNQADDTYRKLNKIGQVVITVEREGMTSEELYDAVNESLDQNEICPDDAKITININK
tara:strand:- start:1838 stop:2140 length:303 start_codon:yes stop_codon:yes gene_type:complete